MEEFYGEMILIISSQSHSINPQNWQYLKTFMQFFESLGFHQKSNTCKYNNPSNEAKNPINTNKNPCNITLIELIHILGDWRIIIAVDLILIFKSSLRSAKAYIVS